MTAGEIELALLKLERDGWVHVVGFDVAVEVARARGDTVRWLLRPLRGGIYEIELTTAVDA